MGLEGAGARAMVASVVSFSAIGVSEVMSVRSDQIRSETKHV